MGRNRPRGQSLTVLGLGLAFLILGSWSGAQYRQATVFSPFFFSPSGLALSPEGEILVGVQASRLHLYSDVGIFVRGWGVAPEDGRIRMRSRGPLGVEVARENQETVSLYDYRGELLEVRDDPAAFEAFGSEHDRRMAGPNGDAFELGPSGLSRVSDGEARLIVPLPPWPLSLFGSDPMIPVAVVMTLGALLVLVGVIMTADLRKSSQ